jgi:hypothetical protein
MMADIAEVWGYMDETGHSRDQKQRFNGMAGLIAPAKNWESLSAKWNKVLEEFRIPYFHMKDWANSRGFFTGWSKLAREKLYGKLLKKIEGIYPFPLGTIISMEDFRRLNETQQAYFDDPYFLGFSSVLAYVDFFLERTGAAPGVKATIIYSDQVEFRHRAKQYYEVAYSQELTGRIKPPSFDKMQDLVPLQAADIVAYEFYKECERRRYRTEMPPRYGWQVLVKMTNRLKFHQPLLHFQEYSDLLAHANSVEKYFRKLAELRDQQRAEGERGKSE